MSDRKHAIILAAIVTAATLAACGGGGGGGGNGGPPPTSPPGHATASPTPSPTPIPTASLPPASPVALSVYAIDSQPRGQRVIIDGNGSAGVTPLSTAPAYFASAHTIAIGPAAGAPSGTQPYTVTVQQNADGPHPIFYNADIDTVGKIASVSTATQGRRRDRVSQPPFAAAVARRPQGAAGRPVYSDRRIFVRYDGARVAAHGTIAAIERAHAVIAATTLGQRYGAPIERALTLAPGVDRDATIAALARTPGVISAERVPLRYSMGTTPTPVEPNDPAYATKVQWYLDEIGAPGAWGYNLGSPSIHIAVIDTGYDPGQPEIAKNVAYSAKVVGGTIDDSAGAAIDHDGHGTYVSAIADAQTNNGAGGAGVAFGGVTLDEYRVTNDPVGGASAPADATDVALAIRQAILHHANVILLPLGGTADMPISGYERDAVAYAISRNITVVAASGNEGASTLDYPAAYDGVISVGDSAVNDTMPVGTAQGNPEFVASSSNYGPTLGLVAPGGDPNAKPMTPVDPIASIYSSYSTVGINSGNCSGQPPSECTASFTGTSPAAAIVAGAAALLLSNSPTLTPAQVAGLMYGTADTIAGYETREGHGRLDLFNAMALLNGNPQPNPAPSPRSKNEFVAIAYDNSGMKTPHILNVTYPHGVPVAADGTFRLADIPVAAEGTYKIGVWLDANGDRIVDAGDYFAATALCTKKPACAGATTLSPKLILSSNFVLP